MKQMLQMKRSEEKRMLQMQIALEPVISPPLPSATLSEVPAGIPPQFFQSNSIPIRHNGTDGGFQAAQDLSIDAMFRGSNSPFARWEPIPGNLRGRVPLVARRRAVLAEWLRPDRNDGGVE
jgi:hypothetical protein